MILAQNQYWTILQANIDRDTQFNQYWVYIGLTKDHIVAIIGYKLATLLIVLPRKGITIYTTYGHNEMLRVPAVPNLVCSTSFILTACFAVRKYGI
jgi:hypothetical protein